MDGSLIEKDLIEINNYLNSHNFNLNNIKDYENKLKNVSINKYFPIVPKEEKYFIWRCYLILLDYLYIAKFKNENDFWLQLCSNKYQDMETIFLLLLPFLKNENTKKIKSINELIYEKNEVNLDNFIEKDIVKLSKELKYTNKLITLLNNQKVKKLKIDYRKIIITHLELTLLTLRKTNHKMMINWQNIFPMKHSEIDLFGTKFLIPKDDNLINDTIENINITNTSINPKGLWLGDIYQHIYNRFYLSILPSKFLIYPYYKNETIIYGAEVLNDILIKLTGLKEINYNMKFYDYSEENQLRIKLRYNNLELTKNEKEYIETIMVYLIYSSDLKKDISELINRDAIINLEIISSDLSNNPDEDKFINFFKNLLLEKEVNKLIDVDQLINFIYDSIQKFSTSPYFRFLYKYDNNKLVINKNFKDNDITIKWIYNWSKSIVRDNNYNPLPKFVDINPELCYNTFTPRLNPANSNWFNIDQNIIKTYGSNIKSSESIHIKLTSLENNIPIYLILIFDDMLRTGVLSEFIINTDLTDKTKFSSNKNNFVKERSIVLKKMFNKNKEWEESYYYWNNKKYNELDEYSLNPNDKEGKLFNKLCDPKSKIIWPIYFSNDWITQLDFYTHFLHQQVMFVTGATGQGKSTQVPKLTSYGIKAYLYKNSGHVIGTQPRTAPTRNNIDWISKELGVPVLNYQDVKGYDKKQELPTDNFYLQFKYQEDKHQKNDKSLKLTMVTDGTLLNEISNSMTLKTKLKIGNNDARTTTINKYEAIMIDEAHEHNTNMDLILSLLKQSLYYNPELRLLIISATMDDDEPLYRSYYSLLDDNLSYPYRSKSYLFSFNIDANYYDRRFHISPPGGTTQYKVDEIYLPVPNLPENIKAASKKTQEFSYKIVKEIADKNPTGEILLFLNGQREISEAVVELNKILPKKTIALPFFTKLHPKYKSMITSIEKNINSLKVRKELVTEYWGEEYKEDKTVINNSYDRAVIIATNVAEASLTINRLKFVVDTGYSKENSYDEINGMTLKVKEISEASRIQRRGRVGRVSTGFAYFLYKKGGREENPPKLQIAQSDPITWMNPFIKNAEIKLDRIKPIMNINIDYRQKILPKKLNILTELKGIQISSQFNFLTENNFQRNNDNFKPPITYYNTIDEYKNKETLLDSDGSYWIIHPKENNITRNVFYKIIKYNNKPTNKISEEDQESINRFIILDKDIMIHQNTYIVNSEMSNLIAKIESELEISKEKATSILYADSLNVIVLYLMTITLLDLTKNDVSKLVNNKIEFIKLKNLCKYESDLDLYIYISKMILSTSNNNLLKNYKKYKDSFMSNLFNQVKNLKKIYENKEDKLEFDDRYYLKKLKISGEWNNKNIIGKIVSKTKYFKKYLSKNGLYFKLPELFGLDKNKFLEEEFNNNFKENLTKFLTLQFSLELSSPNSVKQIEKIKKDLTYFGNLCINDEKKILFSHIAGNPTNTIVNLSSKNKFKSNFNDISIDRNRRYFSKKLLSWSKITATLPQTITYQHYTTFTVLDNDRFLYCLSNIPIEWLIILDPKYYYLEFRENITVKVDDKLVNVVTPEINYLDNLSKNKFSLVSQYWNRTNLLDIYDNIRSIIRRSLTENYKEL